MNISNIRDEDNINNDVIKLQDKFAICLQLIVVFLLLYCRFVFVFVIVDAFDYLWIFVDFLALVFEFFID